MSELSTPGGDIFLKVVPTLRYGDGHDVIAFATPAAMRIRTDD
jgi:hypothetical protein